MLSIFTGRVAVSWLHLKKLLKSFNFASTYMYVCTCIRSKDLPHHTKQVLNRSRNEKGYVHNTCLCTSTAIHITLKKGFKHQSGTWKYVLKALLSTGTQVLVPSLTSRQCLILEVFMWIRPLQVLLSDWIMNKQDNLRKDQSHP